VVSFTEDVAGALGDNGVAALARLRAIAGNPLLAFRRSDDVARLVRLCRELLDETSLAREGYEVAARSYLALIGIEVARLAASRKRTGAVTLSAADPTVEELRRLIETHFQSERNIGFYAGRLAMTPDRLNDHVKRATGVTAGHLLRQRILTEAKRQLVFTRLTVSEIAYDLAFADPSHFGRFFKKQTGKTPQAFRDTALRARAGAN
jgi:AraC family transcriptional activator of pobA